MDEIFTVYRQFYSIKNKTVMKLLKKKDCLAGFRHTKQALHARTHARTEHARVCTLMHVGPAGDCVL